MEAANNKIGSPLDAVALLCYHYNPATGRYDLAYMALLRGVAIATVLILAASIIVMKRRERRPNPDLGSSAVQGEA